MFMTNFNKSAFGRCENTAWIILAALAIRLARGNPNLRREGNCSQKKHDSI